jgi:alpha-D-ribose 1-methylphosphonate 5-triphosphate synthase subunit PhnG
MFHNSDVPETAPNSERREWMALLSRAPIELLESTMGAYAGDTPQWLRAPETGLMMVQGRIGGTGERFNLGEVTLTRCALRAFDKANMTSTVGVAYVTGRSHRRAQLAAIADAMLQDEMAHAELQKTLLAPTREHLVRLRTQRYERAQSTKVEFFTVARETSGPDNDEVEDQ